ncbi:MAG: aminotransferase class V-fold PLP-dependent enzyme [Alphaproteobacteria bacterium]|nr:aminotransferase class V-fold PLP-dependent enzyme [Alphaproteobacteria bacterium]
MEMIYLDYNGTAPLRPQVRGFVESYQHIAGNASSVHALGRKARSVVENARENVAALANALPENMVFNSGATEANNTVIRFFAGKKIYASAIEHPSVLEAGITGTIPVTRDGVVDLAALEKILQDEKPALVSVMYVNNETGVIQPIEEIVKRCRAHDAKIHCDAVQAAGRIPLDIKKIGVDYLTLSAHKIGGLQGAGALIIGMCRETPLLLNGGGQEKRRRAGTENVFAIGAFGVAAEAAKQGIEDFQKIAGLRDRLEAGLKDIAPSIIIHGINAPRVANTSFFSLPNISSETQLIAMDLARLCVSNGSACSSGTVKSSYVLEAMGCSKDVASSALRVSLGWESTEEDIEKFLAAYAKFAQRIAA